MAESSLLSDAVVEDLDVFGDLALGLLAGREATVMHQFGFQGTPAAFHRCVVPTVALATHRGLHTELPQELLVGMGVILAAAIRVVEQPLARPLGGYCPKEGA